MSKDKSTPPERSHPVDASRRRRIEDPDEYERGRRDSQQHPKK